MTRLCGADLFENGAHLSLVEVEHISFDKAILFIDHEQAVPNASVEARHTGQNIPVVFRKGACWALGDRQVSRLTSEEAKPPSRPSHPPLVKKSKVRLKLMTYRRRALF